MKEIFKVFLLVAALLLLFLWQINIVYAYNTEANYVLTNEIYITADNVNTASNTNYVAVASNFGGEFTREPYTNYVAYSNFVIYITNVFYNSGNHEDIFSVGVTHTNYNGNTGSQWGFEFQKLSGSAVTSFTLGYKNSFTNRLCVTIPSDARAISYADIVIGFKTLTATTLLTNYVGDNTTNYGGDLGDGVDGNGYINPMTVATTRIWVSASNIHFVSKLTNNPVSPYLLPVYAATNIQDAINVCNNDDIIYIIDSYTNYYKCSLNGVHDISLIATNGYSPLINGHGVSGPGIYINNSDNITVNNVDVTGFTDNWPTHGIEIRGSSNVKILNSDLYDSVSCIDPIEDSKNITVSNCNFWVFNNQANMEGIYITSGRDIRIKDNYLRKFYNGANSRGIYVRNLICTNILIYNNRFVSNYAGVYLSRLRDDILVSNNYFLSNSRGIIATYITNVNILNNEFVTNGKGIEMQYCYSNTVGENSFRKSTDTGFDIYNYCFKNSIVSNVFKWNYSSYVLNLNLYSRNNYILKNTFISNTVGQSVYIQGNSPTNFVKHNMFKYNYRGVQLNWNNGGYHSIVSNKFFYQSNNNIYLDYAHYCLIAFNIIYGGTTDNANGIRLGNTQNAVVRNNTILSNGSRGIQVSGTCTGTSIRNNIVYKHRRVNWYRGIDDSSGDITYSYNDVCSNEINFNGSAVPGTGTISNNPLFLSENPNDTDFVHLSGDSPCIDTGDPSDDVPSGGGGRIDMGAIEFTNFGPTTIVIYKVATNISIGGAVSQPVPGSTVLYTIIYSNTGASPGKNIVIYDKLPSWTTYVSNSTAGTGENWQVELSTNSNPDVSYTNTSDWFTNESYISAVKWIRWKKSAVVTSEDGLYLQYKVTIK